MTFDDIEEFEIISYNYAELSKYVTIDFDKTNFNRDWLFKEINRLLDRIELYQRMNPEPIFKKTTAYSMEKLLEILSYHKIVATIKEPSRFQLRVVVAGDNRDHLEFIKLRFPMLIPAPIALQVLFESEDLENAPKNQP